MARVKKVEIEARVSAELLRQKAIKSIPLDALPRARYITTRSEEISPELVEAYSVKMAEDPSTAWPAVDVFEDTDGTLWLGDGVHRVEASRQNGALTVAAFVRKGGRLEALKHAAGANDAHGGRRTNADKRKAVTMLLHELPSADGIASTELAVMAKVSVTLVEEIRKLLRPPGEPPAPRKGKDGKVRSLPKRKPKAAVIETTAAVVQPEASTDEAPAAIEPLTNLPPLEVGKALTLPTTESALATEPPIDDVYRVAAYVETIAKVGGGLSPKFHIRFFFKALALHYRAEVSKAERDRWEALKLAILANDKAPAKKAKAQRAEAE